MTNKQSTLFASQARSDWIRVRTLIILRWMAITGQALAVFIAYFVLHLQISLPLCLIAIGASVLFNLLSTFKLPANKRLTERSAALSLLFDLFQLVLLLFLTGGLANPFALLLLAPVTISATALTLNATIFLGVCVITAITLLVPFHLPLVTSEGQIISLPTLLLWGNWIALVIGSIFLASYARRVTLETFSMSQALAATQMALDREYKLTMLGGVVAAAAHEMGTPLATIKMVATELEEELNQDADLRDDARLIRGQADRLSQILRDMGRTGKDDLHLKTAPLITVLQEAAQPHQGRGKKILFLMDGVPADQVDLDTTAFPRHPEIIHGLRNLVQNAVDFARSTVWVNATQTEGLVTVLIGDNGPGYPNDFLSRIGDPFLRREKAKKDPARPEYEGMGLGLFIAKTLLERSGATLTFTNAGSSLTSGSVNHQGISGATGALVIVQWPIAELSKNQTATITNPHFEI